MIYKLCYIKGNKAWFTSDWKNQWGDDWDDAPYEHNAGIPYDSYYENHIEHKIKLKELFFEIPGDWQTPCDTFYPNSPFSVESINNHRVPWITYDGHYIFAGISYSNFIKQIKELGGKVYLPKKDKEEN